MAIGPFSLGRVVGVSAAIFAAHLLDSPFDMAVFGAVGAAVALSEPQFAFAAVGLCAAGALSSLFKKRGRAMLCLVFVVTAALMSVCSPNYIYLITYVSEIMFGALLFLVIPVKSASDIKFDRISDSLNSATASIGLKLDCISSSMKDITQLLDKTVEIKDAHCNMDKLYAHVAERVCKQCPLMSHCWVKHFDDTTDAFNKLTPVLISNGQASKADLSEVFASRCMSSSAVLREINRCYKGYLDYIAKIRSTQLYKGMLRKQFSAVSSMLDTARYELCSINEWDEQKSKRIFDCAARLGLPIETASLVYGFEHRPIITVSLSDSPVDSLVKRLTAGLSIISGATLSPPVVSSRSGSTILCFSEQPCFTIQTAVSQIGAEKEVCGDVYSVFTDLHGNVHLLLSDGMGTGRAAERDGVICCAFLKRLLESGFPIKQAAELANTALALREDNESASTLDALSLNVFSGEARLFKAGAAPTYILHGSRVEKIGGRTLPVGILEYVMCKETRISLYGEDILVMASDGAEQSSSPFIEQTLKLMY
ncbi:MAG: SpoIIE family protein phosphatase, partial [Oscillospiraceae bacterium]